MAIKWRIRDQIISKCRSNELRRKLMEKGRTLTLQTLQEIARNYEAVGRQTQSMSLSSVSVKQVDDRRTTGIVEIRLYQTVNVIGGRRGHSARDPLGSARGK